MVPQNNLPIKKIRLVPPRPVVARFYDFLSFSLASLPTVIAGDSPCTAFRFPELWTPIRKNAIYYYIVSILARSRVPEFQRTGLRIEKKRPRATLAIRPYPIAQAFKTIPLSPPPVAIIHQGGPAAQPSWPHFYSNKKSSCRKLKFTLMLFCGRPIRSVIAGWPASLSPQPLPSQVWT